MIGAIRHLVGKDLRILRRSVGLSVGFLLYPLLVGVLLGVAADRAGQPRIALVDEAKLPAIVDVAGTRLDYGALLADVDRRAEIVRLKPADAAAELRSGSVAAVITIPRKFIADLRSTLQSPAIRIDVRQGTAGERATREVQSLVYGINERLQRDLLETNIGFLKLLVAGGSTEFLGQNVDILGLDRTAAIAEDLRGRTSNPADQKSLDSILDFARDARLAVGFAEPTLRQVAHPVVLETRNVEGRGILEGRAAALVAASTLLLLGLPLGARLTAIEREEGVGARLFALGVSPTALLTAKIVLTTLVVTIVGIVVCVAATLLAGGDTSRVVAALPILVVGSAAAGSLGALCAVAVRDAAAAPLITVLVAVPFLLAGVLGISGGVDLGGLDGVFPLSPLAAGLDSALFAPAGLRGSLGPLALLAAIALIAAVIARPLVRRLAS